MSSPTSSAPSSVPPPPLSSAVSTPGENTSTPPPPPPPNSTSEASSSSLPGSTSNPTSTSPTSTPPPSSDPSTSPSSFSSSPSSSTPLPRLTPTPSESPSTYLSVSNGNTIVVTTIIRSTPSSTGSVKTNTSKGFFDNTGAVAGTFSVVGLVGLGILIFIVTAIIRRRRAERFDKDVALAAAEAAATAHNPDFDDEYGYGSTGHGVGGFGYADTYHQDPVTYAPTREAYGVSGVGGTAYADPDNYSGTGGGPGAAGIGAGILYRSKSGKNQPDPFNAYAVNTDATVPQHQANMRYRNPAQDHREDPSLVRGGYDVARNTSQPHPDGGVARSKSMQSTNPVQSLASRYSAEPLPQDSYTQKPSAQESYLDHYRTRADSEGYQPQMRPVSTASVTDAYSGITPGNPPVQQPPAPEKPGNVGEFPNPFEGPTSGDYRLSNSSDYSEEHRPGLGHGDPGMSPGDDEDYGAGRRVLKVANE